ncbi:LPXTG cell wall anchor domain-containing protein [Actinokineospora inagensis]|uniref:LPXTG cell wall anchor domain-containing protein n=1 Tax=Actinokineospora inagensis TaxID=103730 RepID=UPI00040E958A|nr:LPXTG cell wall anchor domain-containing protein [Actinokineospora inagensis]
MRSIPSRDWLRSAGRAAAITAIVAGALSLFAGTAGAHTPSFSAQCANGSLHVKVEAGYYNKNDANTVTVTDNGQPLSAQGHVVDNLPFGESYLATWDLDGTVRHTLYVKIGTNAANQQPGWTLEHQETYAACVVDTTKPTTTTTRATTTTSKPPVTTTTESKPTKTSESTTPAVTTTQAPTTASTVIAAPASNSTDLPDTGASVGLPIAIGGVLLLGGGGALFAARRAKRGKSEN